MDLPCPKDCKETNCNFCASLVWKIRNIKNDKVLNK